MFYRNSFRFWHVDKNYKIHFNLEISCKTSLFLEIETPGFFFPLFIFFFLRGQVGFFLNLKISSSDFILFMV